MDKKYCSKSNYLGDTEVLLKYRPNSCLIQKGAKFWPHHDKTDFLRRAASKDSDQPLYP